MPTEVKWHERRCTSFLRVSSSLSLSELKAPVDFWKSSWLSISCLETASLKKRRKSAQMSPIKQEGKPVKENRLGWWVLPLVPSLCWECCISPNLSFLLLLNITCQINFISFFRHFKLKSFIFPSLNIHSHPPQLLRWSVLILWLPEPDLRDDTWVGFLFRERV